MVYFSKKEKETIGILSLGTFLEYFDFYLYFHLATVLNKVFFSSGEVRSAALLTSFAYCSSYLFRPIGALIFGYIGDYYGRKRAILCTLSLMGISCIGVFFLPTYDDIGVWASIMITLFRALQGMSTVGEVIGGELYLSEYLRERKIFVGVPILTLFSLIACEIALYGVKISLEGYIDWRYLFLGGMIIFLIGYIGRRCLQETPDFIKAKPNHFALYPQYDIPTKTFLAAFFMDCYGTVALFIVLVGINNIFRDKFNYSELQIIERNISFVYIHIVCFLIAIPAFIKFNPYKIALGRVFVGIFLLMILPILFNNYMNETMLIVIQSLITLFCACDACLINSLMYKNTPVLFRFRFCTLSFAFAKAFVALITTFGIVLISPYCGNYTLSIFGMSFALAYVFSIRHFARIDRMNPNGLLQYYEGSDCRSSN